jgi:hypothetical protein
MRLYATLFAALIAANACASAQAAPRCDVMVDVSLSMKGYAQASGAPLMGIIDQLRQLCGKTWLFGDRLRELPSGQTLSFTDQNTLIGDNLRDWVRLAPDGTFLVLLTDNISDSSNGKVRASSAPDPTETFYNLLRNEDSPFSQITVAALRADFSGTLYDPIDKARKPHYRGPRALTAYILGKHAENDDKGYKVLVRASRDILEGFGYRRADVGGNDKAYVTFDVKPFVAESFRVRSRAASIETANEAVGSTPRCSANAHFDEATQTFELVDQPMDENCELKAELKVQFTARWCLVDSGLNAQLALRSSDPDVLKQAVQAIPVTPSRATLCANEKNLTVGMRFSAFRFKDNVSFFDRLKRAFSGTFDATGQLTVSGSVRRSKVFLVKDLADAWSYGSKDQISISATPNAEIQRRVFRLEEGVRDVIPQRQLDGYRLISYPVKIQVRYSQAPLLLLLLGLALLAAALALFFWSLARPVDVIIEVESGGETRAAIPLFGRADAVSDSGAIRLTLVSLGLVLLSSSNGRILRGRFLPLGGGSVHIAPPGARPAPSRPNRSRRDQDADDFGGSDYDTGQSFGGGAEPIIFTVRAAASGKRGNSEAGGDDEF